MIGMMYLVLTALLALQVSSEIVKKFELINNSLENANTQAEKANTAMLAAIEKNLSVSTDAKLKQKVQNAAQVRERTSKLIDELDKIKQGLIEKSGGINPETKSFANPNAETEVEIFMIGAEGSKSGKGYEMQKMLDEHIAYLRQVSGLKPEDLKSLTQSGAELGLSGGEAEAQRNKDFVQVNFQATPMVAALAVISQKQNEIARYEAEVLKTLSVDDVTVKFDKIVAMVRPEARTVAAGTKFKADVFIAASSSGIKPSMMVGGQNLSVNADGMGTVQFTASGGGYDKDGKVKRTLTGYIEYRTPSGEVKKLPVNEDYYVVKPVLQVQSQAVSALYANCGNELKFTVPALGADYKPSFSVSGGSHFAGGNIGDITIVPSGTEVAVTVSSNGSVIGTEKFKVRPVPKPAMKVFSNGRELDVKRGISAPYPNSIEIRLVPDEGFVNLLPKDARFKATSTTVYLVRGSRPVNQVSGDDRIGISGLTGQARPGDRLVIEVKDVKRLNFRGQMVESAVAGSPIQSANLN